MALHIELGKRGEQIAEAHLVNSGYTIVQRNWRYGRFEIDLIASKDNLLHFIEVKARTSAQYGFPEESVTRKKFKFILQAADQYLHLHQQHKNFHIDIISVIVHADKEPEVFMIEDVYL